MTNQTVVAFDLGLKTTGVAWGPGESDIFTCPAEYRSTPVTVDKRNARRAWWIATFRMILLPHPGCIVAVEAPITGQSSGAIETHKMHGWLDAAINDNDSTLWPPVYPSTLKKWATGDGKATKAHMVAAAGARGCTPATHDEADAYLLWAMVTEMVTA